MRRIALFVLFALSTIACADRNTEEQSAPTDFAIAQTVPPGSTISGTVREQTPVGPYIYVRLETASGELWAAVNEAPLTTGADITVYNVMRMEKFTSATLNRTFDAIYFGSLQPPDAAANDETVPWSAHSGSMPPSASAPVPQDAKLGPVQRAAGSDARTIGELFAQKAQLAGNTVSVRGVVVKYNASVMGKNWIHLQDGSGDAAAGTHDLTATTLLEATVGDTVTVTGVVSLNRDLGAGYTYPLLIEDARVVVQ